MEVVTEEWLSIQTECVSTFVQFMDIVEMEHFIRLEMTAVVVNQVISFKYYGNGIQICHYKLLVSMSSKFDLILLFVLQILHTLAKDGADQMAAMCLIKPVASMDISKMTPTLKNAKWRAQMSRRVLAMQYPKNHTVTQIDAMFMDIFQKLIL